MMGNGKVGSFMLEFRWGGHGLGIIVFLFSGGFLSCSQLFCHGWYMTNIASVSLHLFFLSLSLATLIRVTSAWEMLFVL